MRLIVFRVENFDGFVKVEDAPWACRRDWYYVMLRQAQHDKTRDFRLFTASSILFLFSGCWWPEQCIFCWLFNWLVLKNNLGGFVKSPSAALRCILGHCGVQVSTPHSVGFARLASESFYCAVWFLNFFFAASSTITPKKISNGEEQDVFDGKKFYNW